MEMRLACRLRLNLHLDNSAYAAYKVRRSKKASRDAHYLGNLPILNKSGQQVIPSEEIDVPTAVERLIQKLEMPRSNVWPQFAARNLYDLLEEESFSNIEALNRALTPHWMALWKAAATQIADGIPRTRRVERGQMMLRRLSIPRYIWLLVALLLTCVGDSPGRRTESPIRDLHRSDTFRRQKAKYPHPKTL